MPISAKTASIPIAATDEGHGTRTHALSLPDLLRSMWVVGKTGTGKSVLLERVALGAIRANWGCALIDPHGDLANRVLALLPRARWNDVVHFQPKDEAHSIGLNLLSEPGVPKALLASGIVEVFRRTWGKTLFGPRSEHLLRNAVLALLELPGATLLMLERLLLDEAWRAKTVLRVTDPVVRGFWTREFAQLDRRFAAEVTAPVLNKLGALSAPAVRRAVGQSSPTLVLGRWLERGHLLIADLSGIGRDGAEMLGSLLVTGLSLAAQRRGRLPPEARSPCLLVADEFHAFASASFGDVLAESRKFGLGAVMAHQHLAQLDEGLLAAIRGNAGSIAAFRLGAADAREVSDELGGAIAPVILQGLPRHHVALRLLADGEPRQAAIGVTLPPPAAPPVPETLLRISRERYARPAATVDREISDALGLARAVRAPRRGIRARDRA